jgi:hypothetical protein
LGVAVAGAEVRVADDAAQDVDVGDDALYDGFLEGAPGLCDDGGPVGSGYYYLGEQAVKGAADDVAGLDGGVDSYPVSAGEPDARDGAGAESPVLGDVFGGDAELERVGGGRGEGVGRRSGWEAGGGEGGALLEEQLGADEIDGAD